MQLLFNFSVTFRLIIFIAVTEWLQTLLFLGFIYGLNARTNNYNKLLLRRYFKENRHFDTQF